MTRFSDDATMRLPSDDQAIPLICRSERKRRRKKKKKGKFRYLNSKKSNRKAYRARVRVGACDRRARGIDNVENVIDSHGHQRTVGTAADQLDCVPTKFVLGVTGGLLRHGPDVQEPVRVARHKQFGVGRHKVHRVDSGLMTRKGLVFYLFIY